MRDKLRRERRKNGVPPQPQAVKKTPAVTVKKTRAVTAGATSSAVKKTGAVTASAASSSHAGAVTSEMPACERNLYKYTGNY